MAITARCPGCGQTLSVDDQYAGMQAKCPTCNSLVTFPAAASAVPVAAPQPLPATPPAVPPPSMPTTEPFYAGAQAPAAGPSGLASLDPAMLTYIGLGGATFFYVILLISAFLPWRGISSANVSVPGLTLNIDVPAFGGTFFGDGRMLFCLTLAILIFVAVNFLNRRYLPQTMVLGGAFATFVVLMMLGWMGGARAGVILGLIAAVFAAASCIWTAVRQPFLLETSVIPGGPSFFRTYGALLIAEAAALILGFLYCILRAISSVV
jgi:phage FluMu protein Com